MKSIYIKILLFFVLVLGVMNTAHAQNTTPLKSSVINVVNVTQMAKAYFTEDISLGNYTGVDFTEAGLMELLTEAQNVQDLLDYDVFTVEFPYISTGANGGLDENFQLSLEQIDSDRYLLFCYVLSNNTAEQMAQFYTTIEQTGQRPPETDLMQEYVTEQAQLHFNEADLLSVAYESEAYALSRLLTLTSNPNWYEEATEFNEEDSDNSWLIMEASEGSCYYTPSGAIISFDENLSLKNLIFTASNSSYPEGSLKGFVLNGIPYIGVYKRASNLFSGYYNKNQFYALAETDGRVNTTELNRANKWLDEDKYSLLAQDELCTITMHRTDLDSENCIKYEFVFPSVYITDNLKSTVDISLPLPPFEDGTGIGFGCGPGTDFLAGVDRTGLTDQQVITLLEIEKIGNEMGYVLLSSYTADAWAAQTDAYHYFYDNYRSWDYTLIELKDALLGYKANIDNILEEIDDNIAFNATPDVDRVILLLNLLNNTELSSLSVDQRINVLKTITMGSMSGSDFWGVFGIEDGERLAIRIVGTIPNSDTEAIDLFFTRLVDEGLLETLDSSHDEGDWPFSDGNYKKFAEAIFKKLKIAKPIPVYLDELSSSILAINVGTVVVPGILSEGTAEISIQSEFTEDNEIKFTIREPSLTFTSAGPVYVPGSPTYLFFNPLEYIVIKSAYDIVLDGETMFAKESTRISPAYFLHYYLHERSNSNARKAMSATVSILLTATSVGGLSSASALVRGISLLDIVIGAGGAGLTLYEDDILAHYGQEEGREFINAYNKLALIVSVGSLGTSLSSPSGTMKNALETDGPLVHSFIRKHEATNPTLSSVVGQDKADELIEYANKLENLFTALSQLKSTLRLKFIRNGADEATALLLADEIAPVFQFKLWGAEKLTDELAELFNLHGVNGAAWNKIKTWPTPKLDEFNDLIADNSEVLTFFKNTPTGTDAFDILHTAGTPLKNSLSALEKISFLKTKGLTDAQLLAIGQLDDIKTIELAATIAGRLDFSNSIKNILHEMVSDAKLITQKPFASEIPNFLDDLKSLTSNVHHQNLDELKAWLKDFKGNSDSGLELELERALAIANDGKNVHLGHNPLDASGSPVLVNGNPVDIDVFNATDDILIECKRTASDFDGSLGKIGLKFNSETKLPSSIRDMPGRKLEGVIHVKNEASFNNPTDRDAVLYRVLEYVDSNSPQRTSRIVGINRLDKLHIKIGDNIEHTLFRNEW